jgi:hypothetical protein
MSPPREAVILRQILDYLRLLRIPAWRANSGQMTVEAGGRVRRVRFNGAAGCSDVLGLLPPSGRFLAVEVKRPGRKPTASQQGFLDAVTAAGGLAVCVHSVRELQAALDAAKKEQGDR